ncbi:MAG: hypothetical protein R3E60_01210 [Alphaproteobacteria bacterium]
MVPYNTWCRDSNADRCGDLDGDGKIEGGKELSFAQHTAVEGDTDLEDWRRSSTATRMGFWMRRMRTSPSSGWQDRNGDGVSDAGEVKTLAEMGIRSIGLVSDHRAYTAAGNLGMAPPPIPKTMAPPPPSAMSASKSLHKLR